MHWYTRFISYKGVHVCRWTRHLWKKRSLLLKMVLSKFYQDFSVKVTCVRGQRLKLNSCLLISWMLSMKDAAPAYKKIKKIKMCNDSGKLYFCECSTCNNIFILWVYMHYIPSSLTSVPKLWRHSFWRSHSLFTMGKNSWKESMKLGASKGTWGILPKLNLTKCFGVLRECLCRGKFVNFEHVTAQEQSQKSGLSFF